MKNKMPIDLKEVDFNNPEAKKYYNKDLFSVVAPKYDFITKALSFGRDRSWKEILVKSLPNMKNPTCLDIACGTGDLTFMLADKYKNGTIEGIDINEDMVTLSKIKSSYNNVVFKVSDMHKMEQKDNSMDIITGGYALRNSPDLHSTIFDLYRIMKKGGHAGFLDFSKSSNILIQKIQLFLLKLWGSFWGLVIHRNSDIYAYIAESLKYFPDRKRLKSILEDAGFKNVKTKILFFGFTAIVFFEK
jgi:demethylmenaquinone methyltransferase/2-methoxy-6-polyprenyl-1,4-benzoquinol methylase